MSTRKPKLDLDQSLTKLEGLVAELEEGSMSLEASLKTFEEGVKLTRDCQKMLDKAEQKVRTLLADEEAVKSDESESL